MPRRPTDHDRATPIPLVALVLALVLVLGGAAAGVTFLDTHGSRVRPGGRASSSAAWRACRPPELGMPAATPGRLGGWPYRLLLRGTFGAVTVGRDGTDLLQACGPQETALRVVRVSPSGRLLAVSHMFPRAALLASALLDRPGGVYLATARLELAGTAALPPYEIELYRLDPSTLSVTARLGLGRGYAAELALASGRVVVATGGRLLALSLEGSRLETRPLLSFGRSVLEHLAAAGTSSLLVISTLVPGATGLSARELLETLRLHAGSGATVLARRTLPPGSSVQALAATSSSTFVVGGTGALTVVDSFRLPGLEAAPGRALARLLTSLDAAGLDVAGRTLWVHTVTTLECRLAKDGRLEASTMLSGSPAPAVSAVWRTAEGTFALTGSGLGRLTAPRACG